MMTYFCTILTLLIERFVDTVIASESGDDVESNENPSSHNYSEFQDLFIDQGLLHWIMREYGRVLLALQNTAVPSSTSSIFNSTPPNSRPISSEWIQGPSMMPPPTQQQSSGDCSQSTAKARFMYLQPVLVSFYGLLSFDYWNCY